MAGEGIGERVARIEAIVPLLKESLGNLDAKLDKVLEKLEKDLDGKANREEVETLAAKVEDTQKRVWYASGVASIISLIAGWWGKDLFIHK